MKKTGSSHPGLALPKGRTKRQDKGRADRHEAVVKRAVRAACVVRDGGCRVTAFYRNYDNVVSLTVNGQIHCLGPSEWAHLVSRAKTRGQAPELRHRTATTAILCRRHHAMLDGRQRPRLQIDALTDRGADGPLVFSLPSTVADGGKTDG